MNYNFKVYPRKIDIFLKNQRGFWVYECSTNASKTCKQAKESFCLRHALSKDQVKTFFAITEAQQVKLHGKY